ncbi:MAG TPA: FAD-dependent monooxygenase [Xanthobacteraceae bacterium]|nr:FAD-dependent monooxygenase [Xanthobacteraceae bacterium]
MTGAIKTQVLIVGAGPVGLALAIELGLRGIDVTIVEQRSRTGAQPRAKTTNVRTMQHMRRWGLAQRLRALAPLPSDYPTDVVFSTTLFGRTLAVIENAFAGKKCRDPRFPEPAQWVPQYTVEQVLHERIAELPSVTLISGTTLEEAAQSAAGVTAAVRELESGDRRTIHADYLVGADGAKSRVREIIGAKMTGEQAYALNYNLILRIPELDRTPPARRAIMYWLINRDSPGVLSPLDCNGEWAFITRLAPGVTAIDDDEVIRRVHAAIGRPLPTEIVTRDYWAAHRLIADRYRDRRIFLAGDACHLHPPFGGYGMNLGIADGVDLGWKLAAVLRGWGGDGLLAAYEDERRPVHLRTIAEAVENYRTLSDQLLKDDLDADSAEGSRARAAVAKEIVATKTREFDTLGVVLGSRYDDSRIIVDDGSAPPAEHYADFEPSAHPGCLAPHAWLADGASLYDQFGLGFTLLVLNDSAAPLARDIENAAVIASVPLSSLDLRGSGLEDLYAAPLALVRPDQFVAWRGSNADPAALLRTVSGRASHQQATTRILETNSETFGRVAS